MRCPTEIAKQIKKEVPKELEHIHAKLIWFISDFSYKAPEQYGNCFERLTEFVNVEIMPDNHRQLEKWHKKVAAILTNTTVEKLFNLSNKNIDEYSYEKLNECSIKELKMIKKMKQKELFRQEKEKQILISNILGLQQMIREK